VVGLALGIRLLAAAGVLVDARNRIASATAGSPSASAATAATLTSLGENMDSDAKSLS
jgi:hypothetical protein